MPTLQELIDQRANVWSQMTEVMERNGGVLGAEDAATYDKAEKDLDALGEQIDRAERHAKAKAAMGAVKRDGVVPGPRDGEDTDAKAEAYAAAFSKFVRNTAGLPGLDEDDRRLVQSGFVAGEQFKNAAGVATGAAGGFMVPPEFRNIIVEQMLAYGPMLRLADLFETTSGANIPWPSNDDTGNEGAILAENTQITEQDLTLGQNSLDAFVYTSKLVRASYQLMQDRPDFDTFLARKLGERLARIYNRHCTVGTGTGQPDGLFNPTATITGSGSFATTGGVSYDNLIDLMESVDEAYLAEGGQAWMMHQTMRKAIRKLKDTQGRPLWEPSVQAGQPDQLLGYGIAINNHTATLAQNSKSLGFGNVREAYAIRVVRQNELVRLNERYADFLQVGFFAFGRLDGTLQNGSAFKTFQTTPTA